MARSAPRITEPIAVSLGRGWSIPASDRRPRWHWPARLFLLSFGLAAIGWALAGAGFRDAEGSLTGAFVVPLATGVGLILNAATVGTRFARLGGWAAVTLVGQAVTLQLVDAGNLLHFQHYRSPAWILSQDHAWLLAYVAFQSVLVARGIARSWPEVRTWGVAHLNRWQAGLAAFVLVAFSAALSRELLAYAYDMGVGAFIGALNLATVLLMARAIPHEALGKLHATLTILFGLPPAVRSAEPGGPDRFAVALAAGVILVTALLSAYVYERHPHITDEVMYIYQARYFDAGEISVPAPPAPDALSVFMISPGDPAWFSPFPPGWPALLAVGRLIGADWLVDPLLAGTNVLLVYVFLRELYPRRTARIATLLFAVSPWQVFLGMSFMSHTSTLTGALVAAIGVFRVVRGAARAPAWAALGGLGVGFMLQVRPLDGAIVGGLLGLLLLVAFLVGRGVRLTALAAFGGTAGGVAALMLPYNAALTGKPTYAPTEYYFDRAFGPGKFSLGFGPDKGFGWPLDALPGHSPLEALLNAALNAFQVNTELLGWATGSLLLVALFVASGQMRRPDLLLLITVGAVVGAYGLFWYHGGPEFGARYWFLAIVPLLALAARGLEWLEHVEGIGARSSPIPGARVLGTALALCVFALIAYLPWRAADKYHHFLGLRPEIPALAASANFGNGLVLIRGDQHSDYASAWIYNPLEPSGASGPIYAFNRDAATTAEAIQAFPDRFIWLVNGPSLTGRGYQVVAGPLPPGSLPEE